MGPARPRHRHWRGAALGAALVCGLASGCDSPEKREGGQDWFGEPESDPSYSTGNLGSGTDVYPFGGDRDTYESAREWDRKYKKPSSTYEAPSGYK